MLVCFVKHSPKRGRNSGLTRPSKFMSPDDVMGKAGGTMIRCFVSRWHQQQTWSGPGLDNSLFAIHIPGTEQWQGENMQVVTRDRPQIRYVCPSPPKVHLRRIPKKVTQGDGWSWCPRADCICYSWNEGNTPIASFCANLGCQGEHRAVDCHRQAWSRQGESRRESQPEKTH